MRYCAVTPARRSQTTGPRDVPHVRIAIGSEFRHWATVLLLPLAGCRQGNASPDPPGTRQAAIAVAAASCAADSLRPATAAPAEGLWSFQESASRSRVAAMIGPAHPDAGRPRITRRVETLELGPGAKSMHHALDTASVRLESLPPFGGRDGVPGTHTRTGTPQAAAVYALTPLVLLASYEPCGGSPRTPRIRYLRRNAHGQVVTDVMLRRESTETEAALR